MDSALPNPVREKHFQELHWECPSQAEIRGFTGCYRNLNDS
jgi:hypothetical protein